MADHQKQLIFNILEYLNDIKTSSHDKDPESLDVALQCLQDFFELDVNNLEQSNKYSIKPVGLPEVFSLGLARKEDVSEYLKKQLETPAVAQMMASQKEAQEKIFEEKLQQYIRLLQGRNYFGGSQEGTPEYNDKYQKARAKFLEKYSEQQQQEQASSSSGTSATSSTAASAPLSPAQRTQRAEEYKALGNTKLGEKQYSEAIAFYTQAIELDGNNAIYYGNRAAAYSSLGNHDHAIEDSLKAIALNPSYTKAHSRLGMAYFHKGSYALAVESYKTALSLEPNNATAKTSLEAAQKKLEDEAGALNTEAPGAAGGMGGLNSLLNNPALRNLAETFKNQQRAGDDESASGSGTPDLGSLLNNPSLMNLAQSAMTQPGFADMMSNPAMMDMAQSFMQNPEALSNIMGSLFGGQGGAPAKQ